MAQNKYMDYNGIKYYDEKLKAWVTAADAKVLSDAKAYADSLAPNYDAAGTAQTKVDALANGAVAANTAAIAALKGDGEGSIVQAVAGVQANVDAVDAKADAAQAAANKAQGEVDALETLVGMLPEDTTATSVVDYVNVKTAGIATDAALGEIRDELSDVQDAVHAIEEDYLKNADKTALQDQITANAGNIATVMGDYLKKSDKDELQGAIDLKAAQSALDAEIARAKAAEEKNAADIALILDNPDTDAVDSVKEFISYVEEHGEVATGLQTQITKNKDDIAALDTAYKAADTELAGRVAALEGIDHNAYKAADEALHTTISGEIATVQGAVDAMDAAYKAADLAIDNRLKAVEGAVGESGSVAEDIATAKQEAIDAAVGTAAADATQKAGKALTDAKAYTDTEIDKVEAVAGQHTADITALKGRMDTAEADIDKLEGAIGEGGSVTVAIAEAKKAGTDAQAEVDALEGVVEALTTRVGTQEAACSAHGDRLTALETKVGDGFVAITNQEIDGLFA